MNQRRTSPVSRVLPPWRLLLGWPGPLWLFPAAGALMGLGTFVVTRDLLSYAYPLWSAVSAAWHESLWVTGAAAAGAAAGLSSALFAGNSALTSPLRPRVEPLLFVWHGLALAWWLVVGLALGLAPAEFSAVRGASEGALAWQDVTAGIAGITVLTMLGFCAGAAVKHWVIAPTVAVLALVLSGLTSVALMSPLGLLLPVQQSVASPEFALNLPTTGYRVITAAVLVAAAATLAHGACARGTVRRCGLQLAVWSVAAISLTVVAFAWRPEFYVVARPVHQVCRAIEPAATVCLHPANAPALDEVVSVVSSLRTAGMQPLLTRFTDRAVAERDQPLPGEAILDIDPAPQNPRAAASSIAEQVALSVSDTPRDSCSPRDDTFVSADVVGALQQRILVLAGFGNLAEFSPTGEQTVAVTVFGRMDSEQVNSFVEAHQDAIRTCQLTAKDLPS